MKTILTILNSIYPLSPELSDEIARRSQVLHVKKKTVLLEAGQTSKTIYFILKGAVRVYYLDKGGVEHTAWLLMENEFAISVYSFFGGTASFEYMETTEDCELIALHKDQLDYLYHHYLEFNFIGRKLTEAYYIRNEEQANNLRTMGAKERYQELVRRNPAVLQRFPLGYIASYLGVAQETLSRIRKIK